MPKNIITITRGTAAPTMRREDVRHGMVFMVKDGRKQYAAIGVNGRAYSLNLATGELASSNKRDTRTIVVGKWAFNLDRQYRPGVGRTTNRAEVQVGEIFTVKGGHEEYVHLGRTSLAQNGWLSIPLSRQQNHAVTSNGNSTVTVVGNARVAATLAK